MHIGEPEAHVLQEDDLEDKDGIFGLREMGGMESEDKDNAFTLSNIKDEEEEREVWGVNMLATKEGGSLFDTTVGEVGVATLLLAAHAALSALARHQHGRHRGCDACKPEPEPRGRDPKKPPVSYFGKVRRAHGHAAQGRQPRRAPKHAGHHVHARLCEQQGEMAHLRRRPASMPRGELRAALYPVDARKALALPGVPAGCGSQVQRSEQ